MSEPKELIAARKHLAKAEVDIATADGLFHLQEGLALLETVHEDPAAGKYRKIAQNLGSAHSAKIHARIHQQVEASRDVPEPELEHSFALIRCFDDTCFELPPGARELKIGLVKRLVDRYYEGYGPEEKQKIYDELARVAQDPN